MFSRSTLYIMIRQVPLLLARLLLLGVVASRGIERTPTTSSTANKPILTHLFSIPWVLRFFRGEASNFFEGF